MEAHGVCCVHNYILVIFLHEAIELTRRAQKMTARDAAEYDCAAIAREAVRALRWSLAARDWQRGVLHALRTLGDLPAVKVDLAVDVRPPPLSSLPHHTLHIIIIFILYFEIFFLVSAERFSR